MEVQRDVPYADGVVRISTAAHTDRGAVRGLNEDSFVVAPPVFAVADGMGGHAHGDRASQTAVAAFGAGFAGELTTTDAVLDALAEANRAVLAIADDHGAALAGTTITGVALVSVQGSNAPHWMAFNVGDSRIYGWDGRTLNQLSVDHSVVQELVSEGKLTREEAERHPNRNIVTRALGAAADVDVDVWILPATRRTTFLLCSDGLTRELSDDEISRIIVFHDAQHLRDADAVPMTLAERLVGAAVAAGGSDNVTVVVVESEPTGTASGDPDDTHERLLEDTRPRGRS